MQKQKSKSALKVFTVLDVLFTNFVVGFTNTEISEKTGFDKPTVHRFLNTLIEAGYAEEINASKRYRPSHSLAQKAIQVLRATEEAEDRLNACKNRLLIQK